MPNPASPARPDPASMLANKISRYTSAISAFDSYAAYVARTAAKG